VRVVSTGREWYGFVDVKTGKPIAVVQAGRLSEFYRRHLNDRRPSWIGLTRPTKDAAIKAVQAGVWRPRPAANDRKARKPARSKKAAATRKATDKEGRRREFGEENMSSRALLSLR
jgi:hypothetical protein